MCDLILDHTVVKGPQSPGAAWPPPRRADQAAPSPQPCRGGKARTPVLTNPVGWRSSACPVANLGYGGHRGSNPEHTPPAPTCPPWSGVSTPQGAARTRQVLSSPAMATPQGAPPGRNTRNRRRCGRGPTAHQLATGGQSPRAKMALGMVFCPFSVDGLGGAAS